MTALARVRDGLRGLVGLPARPAPGAAFMRDEKSPTFSGWRPSLRDTSDDVRAGWRLATSRAVDAIQNSGWLSGAVDQSMASVCGTGLTLNAKPDAAALGWDEKSASEWARRIERRYETWANNPRACDATGRFTMGQLGAQAYRHWLGTGEIVGTLPYFAVEGSAFKTKVKLLPAWRLSELSGPNLIQGVRINAAGAPSAYRFKVKTAQAEVGEVEVKAVDEAGRPIVIHVFDGEPEQYRGITPFASTLQVTRQFDQLANATLTTAVIQAIFAAVFKSGIKTEEAIQALQAESEQQAGFEALLTDKSKWYERTDINLGVHGKIAHLYPGDELEFLRSESPNATYESFAKFLLRECSRPLAMSYEEYSGDWTGATYSSTRMATSVNWPRVQYRRKFTVGRFHQVGYEAFAEEDIESGGTPFPGGVQAFLAQKDAVCRADWRGPPKPQADDLKAAKAHETWDRLGVITDEMICADLGVDVDDVYETRAREKRRREELGIEKAPAAPDPVGDALLTEGPAKKD